MVDDFGVRYTKKEDAEHLAKMIESRYAVKYYQDPDYYLGITLKWDYKKRTVELLIPGYATEALLKFQHVWNEVNCYSPSPYTLIQYGKKMQMAKVDNSAPMDKKQKTLLQQVCGTFLYYTRAVDCTMLYALNNLATKVNSGTQETAKASTHFLNYCAIHADSTMVYRASDMILYNHSDAAYLVASEVLLRVGGYTYFDNKEEKEQIIN